MREVGGSGGVGREREESDGWDEVWRWERDRKRGRIQMGSKLFHLMCNRKRGAFWEDKKKRALQREGSVKVGLVIARIMNETFLFFCLPI